MQLISNQGPICLGLCLTMAFPLHGQSGGRVRLSGLQWVLQISALLLVNAFMVVLLGSSRPHKDVEYLPTLWTVFAVKLDQNRLCSSC